MARGALHTLQFLLMSAISLVTLLTLTLLTLTTGATAFKGVSLENVIRLQGPPRLEYELLPSNAESPVNPDIGLPIVSLDKEFLVGDFAPSWDSLTFQPELVIGLTSIFRASGGGDYLFLTVSRLLGHPAFDPEKVVVVGRGHFGSVILIL